MVQNKWISIKKKSHSDVQIILGLRVCFNSAACACVYNSERKTEPLYRKLECLCYWLIDGTPANKIDRKICVGWGKKDQEQPPPVSARTAERSLNSWGMGVESGVLAHYVCSAVAVFVACDLIRHYKNGAHYNKIQIVKFTKKNTTKYSLNSYAQRFYLFL